MGGRTADLQNESALAQATTSLIASCRKCCKLDEEANGCDRGQAPSKCNNGSSGMKTLKFTYWKDGDYYLGFLNDYPDYQTQGMSKEELVHNLKDLLVDLESGDVPCVRKVEDLVVAE